MKVKLNAHKWNITERAQIEMISTSELLWQFISVCYVHIGFECVKYAVIIIGVYRAEHVGVLFVVFG